MSAWKIATRRLYDMGGGPLHSPRFVGELNPEAACHAKAHGMMLNAGHGPRALWTLTQLGRDWCEGRIVVAIIERQTGRKGWPKGARLKARATWLMSLPRAGEIRLQP